MSAGPRHVEGEELGAGDPNRSFDVGLESRTAASENRQIPSSPAGMLDA